MPVADSDMVSGDGHRHHHHHRLFEGKTPSSSSSSGAGTGTGSGSGSGSGSVSLGSPAADTVRNFYHTKRVGNYLIGRKLGEGSFAKVREGLHALTGEKVS